MRKIDDPNMDDKQYQILSDRGLTSSHPTMLNKAYLQPPVGDGPIISDRSLIFAIGCATFWGDPGTNYLLAIIDIGATIRETQTVQLSEITG